MNHEHRGKSSGELIDGFKLLGDLDLSEGDTLLDAGCGDGYLSIAASGIVGEWGTVYAVDIFEDSLERLRAEINRRGITNVKPLRADITESIPLADGSVDLCLIVNVLHGFVVNGEDGRALGEIARVLKRAGRLAVVEFKKIADGQRTGGQRIDSPGPPMGHRISEEETREHLAPIGFGEEKAFDAGPFHYAIVFRKR